MEILEPEVELKKTKTWQYLNSIRPVYGAAAISFVNAISPLLASIKEIFPFYTRHDAHHCFRVLLRMQEILDKDCFEPSSAIHLTADETLLLICAAYGHDLGMAVFPNEKKELFTQLNLEFNEDWKSNPSLHNYLRKNHSERGGDYISKHVTDLTIPQNLVFMLHKLMEAHNLTINELDIELNKRFSAGSEEINLKQLACILCIADSIEFSETRVVDGVLDLIKTRLVQSEDKDLLLSFHHNMQGICIGDGVAVAKDGKIIFTGTFSDPDTMSLAHNTIDLIENWIHGYIDIDFQSHKKRLIIRGDSIIRQLNIVGYDFERIGIRIKKEHIIDLISSNATWTSDKAIVVRELLQNSVEACRYRQFHSSNSYQPQIKVFLNNTDRTVEIQDNGCGMSRNIILNNFLNVGNSRSFDPSYSTEKYSSLARFGIGFWSIFTIAEKAIIITAPFEYQNRETQNSKVDGAEFEVSIKEFKDFTVFQPKKIEPGTSIKLVLKESVNILDILYRIKYHIGSSTIPISIEDDNGNVVAIPERMQLPSMEAVFGGKLGLAKQFALTEFTYSSMIEEIDIQIKIYYTRSTEGIQFSLPSNQYTFIGLQDRSMYMKFRGSGICGFLFNAHPGTPLLDLNRIGYMIANALNPKGYKFTINRMGLLDSPEYTRYKEIVNDEIHNCYRKFLKTHNAFDAKTICRLNQQSRSHGGENHGSFTGSQLKKLLKKDADLVAFKLYKIDRSKTIENCEKLYIFYNDLIKQNYLLWVYDPPALYARGVNAEHQQRKDAYNYLKLRNDLGEASYILERTKEADMIADNAIDCVVDTRTIVGSSYTPFIFRRFSSNNIDPNSAERFEIASIRGSWAGSLVERPIEGSNFASLSQYQFIVKPNSLIAIDLRNFISQGLLFKAAELLSRLTDFVHDPQDPIFIKYFFDNNSGNSVQAFITVK
jgi:hypothetical protein